MSQTHINLDYAGPERRKNTRHEVESLVDISWGPKSYTYDALKNISESGMFVSVEPHTFEVGMQVLLRFPLPNREYLFEFPAQVKWMREKSQRIEKVLFERGLAFEFLEPTEGEREKLKDFLEEFPTMDLKFLDDEIED